MNQGYAVNENNCRFQFVEVICLSESGRLSTEFYDDDCFLNDNATIQSVLRIYRNSISNLELQMDSLFV